MPNLKRFSKDPEFSDLRIVSSDSETFYVHKIVVCTQSSFFHSACTVDMKEKNEGLITLSETSAVIESMLAFLYSGDYELPQLGSNGLIAAHQAQLYVAAQMYQVKDLQSAVVDRLQKQLKKCANDLAKSDPRSHKTQEDKDEKTKNLKGFLEAITTLQDKTSEDDSTRSCLFSLDWSSFLPIGHYRAPWIEFISKYLEYIADVHASRTNSQYTYQLARSDPTAAAIGTPEKKPALKAPIGGRSQRFLQPKPYYHHSYSHYNEDDDYYD